MWKRASNCPSATKKWARRLATGKVLDVLPLKDAVLVLIGDTVHEVARADLQPLAELEALQKKVEEPCSGDHGCNCGVHKTTGSKRRKRTTATSQKRTMTIQAQLLNELRAAIGSRRSRHRSRHA